MKYFHLLLITIFIGCQQNIQKNNEGSKSQKAPHSISTNDISNGVIYEANIRQYSPEGSFNAFTKDLPLLKTLGIKIIWLMPVNPISTTKSKGPLGSYYAVSDYEKVNPEFGTASDFMNLVNQAHSLGMSVILDWVPGHTGWDHVWIKEHPEYYLKNDRGEIIDPINHETGKSWGWTDVADLDYENQDMQKAMREAMVFWVEQFDIDGFRVDQAYAVPQSFFDQTFKTLRTLKPLFLLAETDVEHPGGIELVNKFDASYHSGSYFLKQIAKGKMSVDQLENHFQWVMENHQEKNILLNYTLTHDVNSWQGTPKELYGDAYHMLTALTYVYPGMPLLYSGQEYDLDKRLLFFEKDDFPKRKGETMRLLKDLGTLKNTSDALTVGENQAGYSSLSSKVKMNFGAENQIFAFQRTGLKDTLVFIANMSEKYGQFTLDLDGKFSQYPKNQDKILSSSYEYVMKPWEYWILIK
ncbi:MAG: alpha-amylase family glycosyl hydrolase [Flavobacteriaceae bacterium]|jgi:alpha-amylase